MTRYRALLGCTAGLLFAGCASTPQPQTVVAPQTAEANPVATAQDNHPPSRSNGEGQDNPTGVLSLDGALSLVLLQNPALSAFSHEVRAAEARARQSRLWSNPHLEVELEEYDRNGAGIRSSETAISIGQRFSLGGERRWRSRMAAAQGELVAWDYESKRIEVLTRTAECFVAVIAAERRLELARSTVAVAEKTSGAVTERVKAGKEPALQASKASAQLALARIGVLRAENQVDVSRLKLAAMWGAETPAFDSVEGDIDQILEAVPSMEVLRSQLAKTPSVARWNTEIRLREAELSAEKAARVPELNASVGLRQFKEDGADALAFGVGMPLPLFDRNQGNIAAARHALARAKAESRAAEVDRFSALSESRVNLISAQNRVRTLRSKVVPAMEEASEAAHEGYRQGKFGFLDMLDSQRGLFEAKGALVDALSDYHVSLAEIQRLTGANIDDSTNLKAMEK